MSQGEIWPKQEEIIEPPKDLQGQEEQVQQQQKRKNKKRVINNPNQSTGHWSEQEHKIYIDFLNIHRTVMESQDQKKTSKIFKQMSETIGTRSPSQCRSHHQKFNPFVHQVKKRQKGAGRKKKGGDQNDKNDSRFQDNAFYQQMLYQQPFYPQQYDYSLMYQPQYQPLIYPIIDGINKEDEKMNLQDQSLQYYQQFLMQQQQQPPQSFQQLDDKNVCYNLSFLHPQQVQFNFNYFQPPNDFLGGNSGELINKDQFDEQ